ncbi:hypothetical protein GQ44DRAFT_697986 [Phaeosphaeriaceae sp. PMI808]|nr:hypothetical protein GQ44DRAFT_697986 [Phaeosphaeriaceae sp. PMI808]
MASITSSIGLKSTELDFNEKGKAVDWQWPDTTNQADYSRDESSSQEAVIAWGIAQCGKFMATGDGIRIDIISLCGDSLEIYPDVTDEGLGQLMKPVQAIPDNQVLKICFINTLNSVGGYLPGTFNFRPSTLQSLRKVGISALLLSNIYTESSHWAKMGNQKRIRMDEQKSLSSFELCYQYRFGWSEPTAISYIHQRRDISGSTYFCINYPANAYLTLTTILRKAPKSAHREFVIDALAAEESLKRWQQDISTKRRVLLCKEKKYRDNSLDSGYGRETRELHGLSNEWLALGEDLVAFHAQLGFLRDAYDKIISLKSTAMGWNGASSRDEYNPFEMLISQTQICSRWTTVYRARTETCIQMLFHLSNQAIANSSQEIAEQTQRDSASMITVAAVTLVFLPGTFISALLSTTVFDYGHEKVQVSQQWWVLLATTIPLTVAVVAFWVWWRYVWLQHQDAKRRASTAFKQKSG